MFIQNIISPHSHVKAFSQISHWTFKRSSWVDLIDLIEVQYSYCTVDCELDQKPSIKTFWLILSCSVIACCNVGLEGSIRHLGALYYHVCMLMIIICVTLGDISFFFIHSFNPFNWLSHSIHVDVSGHWRTREVFSFGALHLGQFEWAQVL